MANAMYLEGAAYKNITSAQTTYLANSYGTLFGVSLNTNGATVTVYDSTSASGTPIGIIASDAPEGMYLEQIGFSKGLTVVTGGSCNVTFAYAAAFSTTGPAVSMSPSISPSKSPSLSPSASPSLSPSLSSSVSPSQSLSPSLSPSISPSPSE